VSDEIQVSYDDDAALLAVIGDELDAVEAALSRLETADADRCLVCQTEVSRADLLADPLRPVCPACAAAETPDAGIPGLTTGPGHSETPTAHAA
jgi:RNA polymerase-binding transcription factor DksA